jgi:non-ribosomal peptide synthetase component E (peptide arylation enzyme)
LNVEVEVDETGQEVPTGEVGEVIVKGYHIMKGIGIFHRRPQRS